VTNQFPERCSDQIVTPGERTTSIFLAANSISLTRRANITTISRGNRHKYKLPDEHGAASGEIFRAAPRSPAFCTRVNMLSIRPHFDSARPRPMPRNMYSRSHPDSLAHSLQFHDSRAVLRVACHCLFSPHAQSREYLIKNMCSAKIECARTLSRERRATPLESTARDLFPLLDTLLRREKQLFKRDRRRS